MKTFNWFLFVAAIAALSLVLGAAVLSCRNLSQDDVDESSITGIAKIADPTRTVYGLGETLDLSGLEITAIFNGVHVDYPVTAKNLSPVPNTADTDVPITVTVNGHQVDFTIDVFPVVTKSSTGDYTGYEDLAAAFAESITGDTIILYENQTITDGINPQGMTITLQGYGAAREITHTTTGIMFDLSGNNTKLILGDKITLDGKETSLGGDEDPLVQIMSGANLIMKDGSIITGGKKIDDGAGVYVGTGGALTMFGGAISGNEAADKGGGVCVGNGGIFAMSGGTISRNETSNGSGGGVFVDNGGIFTMSGGTISGNEAGRNGGGVYVVGTFAMSGGAISGNEAGRNGGGVNVGGTFAMSGGTISGNEAVEDGGGVCVAGYSKFTYHAGTIEDNTAASATEVFKRSDAIINGTGGVYAAAIDDNSSHTLYDEFPPPQE
jgi:hypothetical protein